MFKFELGQKCKDEITGFQGVITARIEYLNGCIRYAVQSNKRTAEGKIIEDYIDEEQLISMEPKKKTNKINRPGGPHIAPKYLSIPNKY
jgi:hypothetical protein